MPSQALSLTVDVRRPPPKPKPRNEARFVEIYSPRADAWVWTVAFDDLGYSRSGKASTFEEAQEWVRAAIAVGQVGT